jgi:hypothetical protein
MKKLIITLLIIIIFPCFVFGTLLVGARVHHKFYPIVVEQPQRHSKAEAIWFHNYHGILGSWEDESGWFFERGGETCNVLTENALLAYENFYVGEIEKCYLVLKQTEGNAWLKLTMNLKQGSS